MTAVKIGRIATYRKARIHLALDGRTACGVKGGAGVRYECARPDLAQPGALCRRCFTGVRVGRAQLLLTSATGEKAERNRILLADVADTMTTPEQCDRLAVMAAEIRASLTETGVLRPVDPELAEFERRMARTVELAPAVQALPPAERPRNWAVLREEFAATHPQTSAA